MFPLIMSTDSQPAQCRGGYLDNYRRTLDSSRRVLIPSSWREADPAPEYTILPFPLSKTQYLVVLPPRRWEILVQRMGETSLSDPQAALIQRAIASSAVRVKPDSTGRIVLPENLLNKLRIDKEVALVGRLEMFEIWNPEDFYKDFDVNAEMADKIIESWNI